MREYQVTSKALFLNVGVLALSADQVKDRAHNLRQVSSGVFEIRGEVCFKRGERFGYDGEISRAMAEAMKTPDEIAADAGAVEAEQPAPAPAGGEGKPAGKRGRPRKEVAVEVAGQGSEGGATEPYAAPGEAAQIEGAGVEQ